MANFEDRWWGSVESALVVGKRIAPNKVDLNAACEHIVQLLTDASNLLELSSHSTAAFISITALEETAKLHIGKYRKGAESGPRRKDALYKHNEKHHLALGPTVAMGGRLNKTLGDARLRELMQMAQSGELVGVRESALYFEQAEESLVIPKVAITPELSRELLLLAIEAFDDALVGYTNRTFELGRYTDELFEKWSEA
ncbi:MAG: AbiV family abortive infection protein [Pseudomonadota bacterium]